MNGPGADPLWMAGAPGTLAQSWHICVLFRDSDLGDHLGVATVEQKIRCEHRARELLAEAGVPEPTFVEYGYTCLRLFWMESKVMLRIDIDEEETGEPVVLIDQPHPGQPPAPPDDGPERPAFYDPLEVHAQTATRN